MIIKFIVSLLLILQLISPVKFLSENNIPKDCLDAALHAYYTHKNTSDLLVIVDFNLPTNVKRLWVYNVRTGEVLLNTYVTHGVNSGRIYATSFSNAPGSLQSSLGTFITKGVYVGHNGRSIRIAGLDSGINDNAERRHVVIHGAWYADKNGTSWGCFAVPERDMETLLQLISNGTILYAYHS